ncbi:hypothetical protein KO495_12885 [Colwellia sp. D2M02]|uniref:hypothetical protein n=1 Tax=Colwellia sp. D2M02 TaxID=2841562 RepID=UPI001C098822|nr:hypothetical protein [Colwellia sp. D2M02]MBU2894209.1 hypothetical protein [Colwellia sp. D2M02]
MQQLLIKVLLLLCVSTSALSVNFALAIPLSNALQSIYSALSYVDNTANINLKRIDKKRYVSEGSEQYKQVTQVNAKPSFHLVKYANKPLSYYILQQNLKSFSHKLIWQAQQLLQQAIVRDYQILEIVAHQVKSLLSDTYLVIYALYQPEKSFQLS